MSTGVNISGENGCEGNRSVLRRMEVLWEFEMGHRDGANNADAARFATFRASQTSVSEDVWVL